MLLRILLVLACCFPLVGCGGSSEPTVLDQNVEPDPVVSDDYYSEEGLQDIDPTTAQ